MDKAEQKAIIPWPIFPEEKVVHGLLNDSQQFASYYKNQRDKILKPIIWVLDTSIKGDATVITERISKGSEVTQVVRMKRIPATIQDVRGLAHALEVYVMDSEGFPLTYVVDQKFGELSRTINQIIHTNTVDSRLTAYGFDPIEKYNRRVNKAYVELEKFRTSPSNALLRMKWIFNYAATIICRETALKDTEVTEDEFLKLFDQRYPDIAAEGQELLAMIHNIGYDTPTEMKTVFKKIIQKYKLNGFVFV
jgi:hypothetical protein